MPARSTAPDAELVTRAADGEAAAFTELFERYADQVHDHVARWSRDTTLAAAATRHAFVFLLDNLDELRDGQGILPWLLRSARSHAIEQLRRTAGGRDRTSTRVPAAVLAATSTDHTTSPENTAVTHATAEQVWEAAAGLEERTFTVLDLHVRSGLGGPEIAAVMDTDTGDADALVERMGERMQTLTGAEAPLRVYGALARIRAPVAVRTGVMATAAEHFGTSQPTTRVLRRAVPFAAVLVLLLAVAGIATTLRSPDATPAAGPPTAAGEIVASPSPSPTPTPTLDVLASPSPVPVPVPEPTVEPASPPPSPSPQASPSPATQPLAVQIDSPAPEDLFEATTTDQQGRQAAVVPVAATITGSASSTVTWRSSLSPQEPLLQGASGEVALWLAEDCDPTDHTLTVTATDAETGETVSSSVEVTVLDTCADPLAVTIDQPRADSGPIEATYSQEQDAFVATVTIAADANDDVDWLWTTDAGQQLAEQQGSLRFEPREVQVVAEGCPGTTTITIQVEAVRVSDGSTVNDDVTLDVTCFRPA